PAMIIIAVIGAYSIHLNMLDVYILFATMLLGYVFAKLGFSPTSFVIGLVLGPFVERHFREGLWLAQGDLGTFLDGWFPVALWSVVAAVVIGGVIVKSVRSRRLRRSGATADLLSDHVHSE